MKEQLSELILASLEQLKSEGALTVFVESVNLEQPKQKEHGDFATNVAMILAKKNGFNPRDLAQKIIDTLPTNEWVTKTEIAGPGFINFFVNPAALSSVIHNIIKHGETFGHQPAAVPKKVLIEFVSANPTGPLHVGHGRSAVFGDCLANLLKTQGIDVVKEYYVNDAGRQMDILALSIWLRYLELNGQTIQFPSNAYQGDYIKEIAQSLQEQSNDQFVDGFQTIDTVDDEEQHIDALIAMAKSGLGDRYAELHQYGVDVILNDIKDDLGDMGVEFDNWFSEKALLSSDALSHALEELERRGATYEREGAIWFNSASFGDEKDRVIRRSNGNFTYFASDIAYHLNKFERGHDELIDIFGADHHGYMARLRAFLAALDKPADKLDFCLVQFVSLFRNKEKLAMSTRSGSFVTLRELRDEVGNDVVRYFYIMRKAGQHVDFDLDLAKAESSENPVFTIQYAHARICSLFEKLSETGIQFDQAEGLNQTQLLVESQEQSIIQALTKYQEVVAAAASHLEPHRIAQYLLELAGDYHTYYNAHRVLDLDESTLRNARLVLNIAVKQVLLNGLKILGITAPEKM